MAEQIASFFAGLPAELIVFLISILPIVELRGAIPIGALVFELPFYFNYLLSIFGNLLPVPFILIFIPKILDFLERFKFFQPMVNWLKKKAQKHSTRVLGEQTENNEKLSVRNNAKMSKSIFTALLLFVAIPLPGTGAWTGGLVASLFYLPKWQSFFAITLGVLLSGVIMSLASYGVLGFLSFLI